MGAKHEKGMPKWYTARCYAVIISISALVIFPALSAMRLFNNYRSVVICSAVIAVLCAAAGMLISILLSTPVGATIVTVDIIVFAIASLIRK